MEVNWNFNPGSMLKVLNNIVRQSGMPYGHLLAHLFANGTLTSKHIHPELIHIRNRHTFTGDSLAINLSNSNQVGILLAIVAKHRVLIFSFEISCLLEWVR